MLMKYANKLFRYISNYNEIVTYKNINIDGTFKNDNGIYYKKVAIDDINIQDIFEVDFLLTYIDTSETTKHGMYNTRWNVNEGKQMYKNPVIEKNEVGLTLSHDSWSEDWIQDDKYSCSKIVDLYECSEYTIVYTYVFRDGKKLEKPLIEEKQVSAEEFKEKMIKYRKNNI